MTERPSLVELLGILIVAWLASLALGPVGDVAAGTSGGIGHWLALASWLLLGSLLLLGVLALVGAAWRWRTSLLTAPVTPPETAGSVSEDSTPATAADGHETEHAPSAWTDEPELSSPWGQEAPTMARPSERSIPTPLTPEEAEEDDGWGGDFAPDPSFGGDWGPDDRR